MLLNTGIGVRITENSHVNPYALVGYNRTKVTYYERPGAIINDSWEERTQHFFWGGGVFIDLVEGRLALRPEFKWSIGNEGFTDLTIGADVYF
jgi:hypothetical protein